jgi:hypothetical protein
MTYIVFLWMGPPDEREIKCFSDEEKAFRRARDWEEGTEDSGGDVRVFSWDGKRQRDVSWETWAKEGAVARR